MSASAGPGSAAQHQQKPDQREQKPERESDLSFLENIEELNANWPDYQVRGRNVDRSAAAVADGNSAGAMPGLRLARHSEFILQEFQNATDDVFGQLLSGRDTDKEQSTGPPDW